MKTIKELQKLLNNKTVIMGILNVTPDSFSDGGLYNSTEKAYDRAKEILNEGADIIDIGGESTRPGSKPISAVEEIQRVIPVIEQIRHRLGRKIVISVDTYKSEVALASLKAGVNIVNSLGGFRFDPTLSKAIRKFNCPLIIYHIKGIPNTMQKGEIVYSDIIQDIKAFFEEQISFGISKGLKRDQFLIDPGIGFGKAVEQNVEIIKRLHEFKVFKLPIVIGVSRKSHLGKILQEELDLKDPALPSERLEASLAETAVAVLNGGKIIRTHDIIQTKRFLAVLCKFRS